jgi:hypothetical protein
VRRRWQDAPAADVQRAQRGGQRKPSPLEAAEAVDVQLRQLRRRRPFLYESGKGCSERAPPGLSIYVSCGGSSIGAHDNLF